MQYICVSTGLESYFEDLNKERNKNFIWSYVSNNQGLTRYYPSSLLCIDFNPHFRPWYVGAASGQKNIIVLVDISVSMSEGSPSKIKIAQEAFDSVMKTTNDKDFFSVIAFNDSAYDLL